VSHKEKEYDKSSTYQLLKNFTKLVSGLVGLLVTITLPNTYESKGDYYIPWNFYKMGTGFRQNFPPKKILYSGK